LVPGAESEILELIVQNAGPSNSISPTLETSDAVPAKNFPENFPFLFNIFAIPFRKITEAFQVLNGWKEESSENLTEQGWLGKDQKVINAVYVIVQQILEVDSISSIVRL